MYAALAGAFVPRPFPARHAHFGLRAFGAAAARFGLSARSPRAPAAPCLVWCAFARPSLRCGLPFRSPLPRFGARSARGLPLRGLGLPSGALGPLPAAALGRFAPSLRAAFAPCALPRGPPLGPPLRASLPFAPPRGRCGGLSPLSPLCRGGLPALFWRSRAPVGFWGFGPAAAGPGRGLRPACVDGTRSARPMPCRWQPGKKRLSRLPMGCHLRSIGKKRGLTKRLNHVILCA